ncbi:MAG: phytanoyl-CoA dioxygenase [Rhodospirillaceae bacterium]|nr:phytanoyl-CoA dioxygenase [Rhodospirillaceae bacterium]
MLEHEILKHPAIILTTAQREQYFEEGAVLVKDVVPVNWLERLRAASAEMIERSRKIDQSDDRFLLEDGHSPENPCLKRLSSPVDHHPDFWAFAGSSPAVEAAADVVGPDVKYHHSKLNFKWARGGMKFDWHQDIQAWPHTDYSPVTVGLYLEDCGDEQGPLVTIRGSNKGKLHSMYDENRNWVLRIPEERIDLQSAVHHVGPAGSLVILNCRTVHGSAPNLSERSRPFLLITYSSADSFTYTVNPIQSPREGTIVRGNPATMSCHDPRPCEVPPDWSAGYAGPWAHQDQGSIGTTAI